MEESKQQQQQLFFQMQQQQQLQQRHQQLYLMQQLQKQQQQAAISRFPSNMDAHLRPPGLIQNRPVNPSFPNPNPNLIQRTQDLHQQQQQQNVSNQQMMIMMQQNQQQHQQQQQKLLRPVNQLDMQFAYQDAWRVCHPDFKRPFASLEDACERLLPYHVVADYEAEEDDRILLESTDATSNQTVQSRCQQWDNNIAAKVAEFTATFEKQAQAFNIITQKLKDGELRAEERLMIEQAILLDERKMCIDLKSELDREAAAAAARLRMTALAQAGQVKADSSSLQQQFNPLRANAIGNHGELGGGNMNPDEMMMMMNGWGNNNHNINGQRDEKEPLEDFLNDEENENGESGEFDLNIR